MLFISRFSTMWMVFLLILFYPQHLFAKNNASKQTITISGQILNNTPGGQILEVTTPDLLGDNIRHLLRSDSIGKFQIKIPKPKSNDIQVIYKSQIFTLFIGDENQMHIKLSPINNAAPHGKHRLTVDGTIGRRVSINLTFDSLLQAAFPPKMVTTDSSYFRTRLYTLNQQMTMLNNFCTTHRNYDQSLLAWQKSRLKYMAGFDMMVNLATSLTPNSTEDDILKVLKSLDTQLKSNIPCAEYFSFLKYVSTCEIVIVNINPKYAKLKRIYGDNSVPVALDFYDKYTQGTARQILYINNYPDHPMQWQNAQAIWPRLTKVITDEYLKNQLINKRDALSGKLTSFNILNKLDSLVLPTALRAKFKKLFSSYLGKNLHIDFWGDWCQPCMAEMPIYSDLINQLQDTNIRFLFFSAATSDESVSRTKDKFKINGDFINLDASELACMRALFNVQSFPAHFLVNVDSNVSNLKLLNYDSNGRAAVINEAIAVK